MTKKIKLRPSELRAITSFVDNPDAFHNVKTLEIAGSPVVITKEVDVLGDLNWVIIEGREAE